MQLASRAGVVCQMMKQLHTCRPRLSPGGSPAHPVASSAKPENDTTVALFCHLVGHALYRRRHDSNVVVQLVGERAEEARRKLLAIAGGYLECMDPSAIAFASKRLHVPAHARLALLDLEDVSRRTAQKALRRLLAQEKHPLPIVLAERDLTPLRLPPSTTLLYAKAADVVDAIKHKVLLPAATVQERPGKVPTASEVRNHVVTNLLQQWLEEKRITAQQEDTEEPREERTVPLKQVLEELQQSPAAASLPSLLPTQRELSVQLECLGFPVVSHSNTLKVKVWHLLGQAL